MVVIQYKVKSAILIEQFLLGINKNAVYKLNCRNELIAICAGKYTVGTILRVWDVLIYLMICMVFIVVLIIQTAHY